MFKEEKKINFNKGGNGATSGRVILPARWLKHLGITEENPNVTLELVGDQIIIKKAE
ncbi:AbrB/MazE/SpoVT family DNA-binding domain-containing protein [Clostridium perfringens]|uniref:AbrB/MazE/SpoVT family DNA-binding domain-containing protein n=1 Tax=Clostridium perfringens TaxID=1502 RepID=UPI002ED66207|nr:AbrB/MazE/SpoVT family DNA-binding domain-containing protein [Clostridium perfringens]MDM0998682.1 AbrB/MazE/SpoVT family DNA-binding domain-containing protein [Clostridium perfringens]WVM77539.1 AbrB/MazE/SpoVT family DNA-binding domain-containing protein [Clostridium perfringens]